MRATQVHGFVCLVVALGLSPAAHAEDQRETLRFGGYMQLWWTVLEQVENGRRHPITGEDAPDVASGFSVMRARLGGDINTRHVQGRVSVRLEGSPAQLLDAYGTLPVVKEALQLWAGQMKVPSTYEVAVASDELDLITRSRFSQLVVDYSLCRTPSDNAPRFRGVHTYLRDIGVAIKGRVLSGNYFLMVGNGFGAGRGIGGWENSQEVFANSFGNYLYALRLSLGLPQQREEDPGDLWPLAFEVGGHGSYNQHPNILVDDERTVMDIQRYSWSADAHAYFGSRLTLTAMYGEGAVQDDSDGDGKDDFLYRGMELKLLGHPWRNRLSLGIRYDVFAGERYENGRESVQYNYTIGATYFAHPDIWVQANYKWKHMNSQTVEEIADNVLIVALQMGF